VITTEEIIERLGDPSLVLVDARPEDRFRGEALGLDPVAGHIPGAVSVPLSTGARLPAEVLDADEVACYCGSGVAAAATVLALHRAGRSDARLYPGSWSEWSRKGLPAET
jgi:thiosulfate/3-mercaptopyruvate sulfurtransferase